MPATATARHALPNLFVGQSQKEMTHNEALARIDALLHPVIEAELAVPPSDLDPGHDGLCWLVASAAIDVWSGKDGHIARWSNGGWRFLLPCNGMMMWDKGTGKRRFYIDGLWTEPAVITDPSGGANIDVEARIALSAILQHLRESRAI